MQGVILWFKMAIKWFFYGHMSTENLIRETSQEAQARIDGMIEARGTIKGVGKEVKATFVKFTNQLSRARIKLDRANLAYESAVKELSVSPANEQLQVKAAATKRALQLAAAEVNQWETAVKDLNVRIQGLELKDENLGHQITLRDFKRNVEDASNVILQSDESYAEGIELVNKAQKVSEGLGGVSVAQTYLEQRRKDISRRINKAEGVSEAIDDLVKGRTMAGALGEDDLDPEIAAVIAASRERLHLTGDSASSSKTTDAS